MPTLNDLNALVSFALAAFVFGTAFCRMAIIEMWRVQYRYVAPIVLGGLLALFTIFTMIGGDKPDYFTPIGLLGFTIYLLNNKSDWEHGIPEYMLRFKNTDRSSLEKERIVRKQKFQNLIVGSGMLATVVVTGVAAMEGRGDPLQIYSMHAEPRATTPNGTIDIVSSFRRTRVCSGYVERFIVRDGTEEVVQKFAASPVGASKIGIRHEGMRTSIPLGNLAPGNYVYRSTITHYCDDQAAPYIKRTDDVPFIVVPQALPK